MTYVTGQTVTIQDNRILGATRAQILRAQARYRRRASRKIRPSMADKGRA